MDPAPLAAMLAATLSPDMVVNRDAGARLKALEPAAGFGLALLRVAEAPAFDLATRQAAATLFKNFVKRQWVRVGRGVVRVGIG